MALNFAQFGMVFVFSPRGTGNEGAAGGLEHSKIETQSRRHTAHFGNGFVAPGRTRFLTNQPLSFSPPGRIRELKALGERKNTSQDQKEISVQYVLEGAHTAESHTLPTN